MTRERYAEIREMLGTQREVAGALGRSASVICRRESGESAIDRESELALLELLRRRGVRVAEMDVVDLADGRPG
jgi:hypothetical protein